MEVVDCPCGSGRSILLERAFAEGQPVSEARCSSCTGSSIRDIRRFEYYSTSEEDEVAEVPVADVRRRVRRGGRGRGGKPKTVSPALSITSLCVQMYRAGVGDEGYVEPLDKLAVVLDEKKAGYSYVDLLLPSVVSEVAVRLGPSPTLRELLKVGPGKFKPVDTLDLTYVYIGVDRGKVVSSPTSDGAYAKFWAVVRSIPEHELSYAWRGKMGSRWRWCRVPCVQNPGYRID